MRHNHRNVARSFFVAACLLLLAGVASGSPITVQILSPGVKGDPSTGNLFMVPVGNINNTADTNGYGSVNYAYNIGQYDVTVGQYAAFLNSVAATDTYGLYAPDMWFTSRGYPGIVQNGSSGSYTYSVVSGQANRPVTMVTYWDACRFVNWLSNGQPSGTASNEEDLATDNGTYTLTSTAMANNTVTRDSGSTWAVASESEWYKAAYYDPTLNGGAGGYWLYPTETNTISTSQANYGQSPNSGDTTDVGSYAYPSAYGTYDQGGDVAQWNESIYSGSYRGVRGGAWDQVYVEMQSGHIVTGAPTFDFMDLGFRVSEAPEPASLAIPALGLAAMLRRQKAAKG